MSKKIDAKGEERVAESNQEDSQRIGRRDFIRVGALGVAGLAAGLKARPAEPIADLRENVELITASEDYAWVNTRQVWGVGTVNFGSGKIHVEAYMQ